MKFFNEMFCLICRHKLSYQKEAKEIEGFSGDTSPVNHWLEMSLCFM